MFRSRTRHGLLLLIISVVFVVGWSVIQIGVGAGRDMASPEMAEIHPATAAYQPGAVFLTSFMQDTAEGSRLLEITDGTGQSFGKDPLHLNYDDFDKGFTIKIKGFTELKKKGTLSILDERTSILDKSLNKDENRDSNDYSFDQPDVDQLIDKISERRITRLVAVWKPDKTEEDEEEAPEQRSEVLEIKIDKQGPVLDTATLIGDPAIGMSLLLRFTEDDLDPDAAKKVANYIIEIAKPDGTFEVATQLTDNQITYEGKTVRISLGRLLTGNYRVTVKGTVTKAETDAGVKPLTDTVGNFAGGRGNDGRDQQRGFSSYPEREKGERIEFPEYLPTAPQPRPERRFNPSDHVETRVVRLYYFRDAHRVAEILNRTAKSYNRAAVDQARRRAEGARKRADELTDERRHKEREAVGAAEELRRTEHQLDAAMEDVRNKRARKQELPGALATVETELAGIEDRLNIINPQIQDLERRIRDLNGSDYGTDDGSAGYPRRLPAVDGAAPVARSAVHGAPLGTFRPTTFQDDGDEDDIEELKKKLAPLKREQTSLTIRKNELTTWKTRLTTENNNIETTITTAEGQVTNLNSQVAAARDQAAKLNEDALQATAEEDRAHEKQFLLEVGAAHEDPDTYAPAKTDSIDPVAQVSISLIGEGVLQLRGPRKGIDKIRTMIHRIDSPLGQVKVEIVTVQLNGERGDRMEKPVGLVDAHLGLGRFLTAQSLMMLRRAIQMEAAAIAAAHDSQRHYQVDRDRKYLYAFFGRDFIDELYEMDSEFLHSENKLLSLHSMDTIGLHRALFTLALARNDVRQRILCNFMKMVECELPQAEFDYRRSSELRPHRSQKCFPPWNRARLPLAEKPDIEANIHEATFRNARQRYHFRNLRGFFASEICTGNTMNPAQREFIRLAQIFKARMIAEVELKQRVMERALVEDDREESFREEEEVRTSLRQKVLEAAREVQEAQFDAGAELVEVLTELRIAVAAAAQMKQTASAEEEMAKQLKNQAKQVDARRDKDNQEKLAQVKQKMSAGLSRHRDLLKDLEAKNPSSQAAAELRKNVKDSLQKAEAFLSRGNLSAASMFLVTAAGQNLELSEQGEEDWRIVQALADRFRYAMELERFEWDSVVAAYFAFSRSLPESNEDLDLRGKAENAFEVARKLHLAKMSEKQTRYFLVRTRSAIDRNKLLDHLIDERQEKYIDILEGTRAHIASMDNYLKRLAVAMEDDFKVQFYDPAFVRIREAARQWDVTLGVVERTSILTNNRAFAKVTPQATMEFDLPKRDIMIKEAMDAAKALTEDMGALLNDPTFLSAFKMMGGGGSPTKVQNVMPGLPSSTDEQRMGVSEDPQRELGASLEALIPDPAIYKFETGTGFEIRPVIQPDGNSIVYDFMYVYTTNIREPVRADEKHLGRVKRHFINTQVQTSSFELREISRYQVALKAARTAQGVPLLQDIPIAGQLFRPLPSAESSIQENIILGHSVVYPTLFDLMGLRWAPSVVDLNHISVRDTEHIVRGRYDAITNSIFDTTSRRVDEMLDIQQSTPRHYRPDLHHRHTQPSPYHPGGYTVSQAEQMDDPTGRAFEVPDRRPPEWRQPPYDPRFRHPVRYEQVPYERMKESNAPQFPVEGYPAHHPNGQYDLGAPPPFQAPDLPHRVQH